jgi:hypothetical protein
VDKGGLSGISSRTPVPTLTEKQTRSAARDEVLKRMLKMKPTPHKAGLVNPPRRKAGQVESKVKKAGG